MTKLVRLIFNGSFEQGFTVSVDINQDGRPRPIAGIAGRLPAEPEIPNLYSNWQSAYRKLDLNARLGALENQVTNVSSLEDGRICTQYGNNLSDRLKEWLESPAFAAVRRRLSREISAEDDVRILLQSDDPNLYCLPWHLCDLFDHPKLEFAWSSASFREIKHRASGKNRILVILGDKRGINIEEDRKMLEDLPNTDIKFLVQPRREQLTKELWRQQWDMLFFAGHSLSQLGVGRIYINETESLTIGELRFALGNAVRNGLKLAVFNSCDGLGLARSLAELHIPQVIVMREPIPDAVAHIFLKYFLEYFSKGISLYTSVRQARERLEANEDDFPCASWLPMIYQNPTAVPFVWINGGIIGRVKDLIKTGINLLRLSLLTKLKKYIPYLIIVVLVAFLAVVLANFLTPPIDNRISEGKRILITTENLDKQGHKQAGVEAFAKGDLKEAIAKFESSLKQNPNDPEALIYLNNAKIGNTKALKIAVSVPIGSNINIAQEILRGAAQAQDEVNNSGGVNGIPIKLVIADDQNKPAISAQVATKFTNDNTIIAVMGHNFSEAANAAASIYQKDRLVAVFPTSGNVENDNKYIFRVSSSTVSEAKALAKYAKTKNLTKIFICSDSTDRSSRSIQNEFTDSWQKNGGQVAKTTCDFASKDFNPQLIMQKIIAEEADGILLRPNINRIEDATSIAQANQGRLPLMGSSTMYTQKTLDVKQDANGMVVSAIWHPDLNPRNLFGKNADGMVVSAILHPDFFYPRNLFGKNAEKLWNGPVSWRTATSYDSMQVIIAGLKQNPNFTRDGLQQFISQKDFSVEGATGTVKFKTSGERDDESQIILLRVQPNNSPTGYGFTLLSK